MPAVRRRLGEAAACVAIALAAAGCGVRSEPAGAGGYPLQTTDATGVAVRIAAAPRRIVCLAAPACTTLAALGAPATATTAEGVAAAAPDLVVAPLDADAGALHAAAPKAAIFRFGGLDPQAAAAQIARLGLAAGAGARAVALAREVEAGVRAALAEARSGRARRVLVNTAGLAADGPETTAGQLVALAGGENVVQRSSSLTFAALAVARPEVWLVEAGGGTDLASLRANALTRNLPAVRAGRVERFDPETLEPSPTLPQALAALVALVRAPS
jgi:ABC-type Fe3+-hydroxamate transport system substrate-binding protein